MTHRMKWSALGAAALLTTAPVLGQGADELRAYDVGGLARGGAGPRTAPAVLPLRAALTTFPDLEAEEAGGLDVDRIASLLAESGERGKPTPVRAEGRRLWIRGGAATHAAVAAELARLRAALQDEVVVRVGLHATPPDRAVLDAAAARKFLASSVAVAEASTTTASDRAAALRAGTDLAFVADVDVEVAAKAAIGDPVVRRLPLGLTARVAAYALPDGRFLVRVGGVHATLEAGPVAAPLGSRLLGDIQSLRTSSTSVAGAAILESGGAFVLGAAGGAGYWVAQVVRVKPPAEASGDRAWIACDGVTLRGGQIAGTAVDTVRPSDGEKHDRGGMTDLDAPASGDDLVEHLRRALWPEGERSEAESVELFGGKLLVRGGAAFQQRARAAATGFAAAAVRVGAAEMRYGVVAPAAAAAYLAGQGDAAALSGRMIVAGAAGERFRAVAGTERTCVADHDVEIAQEAFVADPIVTSVFSGVLAEGVFEADETGATTLDATFTAQEEVPSAPFATRLPDSGSVDAARVRRADVEARVGLGSAWRLFGTATSGAGVLVVMVRAAE